MIIIYARGGVMYCKIFGERRDTIKVFSINMSKNCMNELTFSNVNDDKYKGYINLIRILLGYFLGERKLINLVN